MRAHVRQCDNSLTLDWHHEPPQEPRTLLHSLLHDAPALVVILSHFMVVSLQLQPRPRIELVTLQTAPTSPQSPILLSTATPPSKVCPSVPSPRAPRLFANALYWLQSTPTSCVRIHVYPSQPTTLPRDLSSETKIFRCLPFTAGFFLSCLKVAFLAELYRVRLAVVFDCYRHDVIELETLLPALPVAPAVGLMPIQPNRLPHLERSSTLPCSRPCHRPCRLHGAPRTPACPPILAAQLPLPEPPALLTELWSPSEAPLRSKTISSSLGHLCSHSQQVKLHLQNFGLQTPLFHPKRLGQCPKPSSAASASFLRLLRVAHFPPP